VTLKIDTGVTPAEPPLLAIMRHTQTLLRNPFDAESRYQRGRLLYGETAAGPPLGNR
jgi:hypothetical protein